MFLQLPFLRRPQRGDDGVQLRTFGRVGVDLVFQGVDDVVLNGVATDGHAPYVSVAHAIRDGFGAITAAGDEDKSFSDVFCAEKACDVGWIDYGCCVWEEFRGLVREGLWETPFLGHFLVIVGRKNSLLVGHLDDGDKVVS